VTAVLRNSLKSNDFPHLLFYGPPGTGKTSTILAIARELFGPKLMKERVLELNASDERGIDVVRHKIKSFAQIAVGGTKAKGYPSPPFKIIILDEADSMTTDAQSALRRTMELHSKVTRFCLICNYVTRIIEPLTSRCAKFRFRPLPPSAMQTQIKLVTEKEDIKIADGVPEALVTASGGDMRRVLNLLQSGHRWKGAEGIEADDIVSISGLVPLAVVDDILRVCQTNNYSAVEKMCTGIILDGYSIASLFDQVALLGCIHQPDDIETLRHMSTKDLCAV
ncbi:replication factor C subunit 4, partial [Sphaeroforma arctica JP610]